MNIKLLQENLLWNAHSYSHAFVRSTDPWRDFMHAHGHVIKALGRIFDVVFDKLDHTGAYDPKDAEKYLADIVICNARMANTYPSEAVDIEALTKKFEITVQEDPPDRTLFDGICVCAGVILGEIHGNETIDAVTIAENLCGIHCLAEALAANLGIVLEDAVADRIASKFPSTNT